MRRVSRTLCAASLSSAAVLSSGNASADSVAGRAPKAATATVQVEQPATEPAKDATPAAASDSERNAALAYEQAQSKYAQHDVAGAYERMSESYRLSQRPELLYNLALLERELQQCEKALEDYKGYLERVPQGRFRAAAEQACVDLKLECPALETKTGPASPPAPFEAKPAAAALDVQSQPVSSAGPSGYWTPPRVVGWSAIAAGVLAGSGALYFTLAAVSARNDYQRSVDARVRGVGMVNPNFETEQHHDQTAAQVLAASGGALITGGALLLLLTPRDRRQAALETPQRFEFGWLQVRYTERF